MAEAPPAAARGARGSYANLICLNCRSRKIKCILPDDNAVAPSDSPQPTGKACQRCKNLGLECIVQRTILGRPAAKRRRDGNAAKPQTQSSPRESEEEVKDYLVTDVQGEGDTPSSRESARPPPSASEIFKTMVSETHLAAVLLANDRRFGVSVPSPTSDVPLSLSKLVSSGLAALLDENLPWHRFFLPLLPTLVELRPRLSSETRAFENKATKLLFALLALLAIDAPVNRLREDQQLRHHLKTAVSYYGQAFLFDPPTHRHTVAALMLLSEYHPTALISAQNSASTSVKAHMYITLTYRIAERLGMDEASETLQDYLDGKILAEEFDLDATIIDALQWCQIKMNDAYLDGYTGHSSKVQWRIHGALLRQLHIIEGVLQLRQPTVAMYYNFWYLKHRVIDMHCVASMKLAGQDLSKLYDICQSIEQTTEREKANFMSQQPVANTEDELEAAAAARILLDLHMERLNVSVVGAATFAALLHGVKKTEGESYGMKDVLGISEIAVNKLKELQIGKTPATAPFLVRYIVQRPNSLQNYSASLVHVAGNLKLAGVPYLPPPRRYALQLLFHCKVMVEENAIHFRGLNLLHPGIESQIKFFTECADRLEFMATNLCRSPETAFADGCLNAASAKFIRCLRLILMEWKTTLGSSPSAFSLPLEPLETFDVFDDYEFDDVFGQWNNWPNVAHAAFLSPNRGG